MSPLVTYQLKDSIATMTMDDGKVEHRFFRRWFFAFCDEILSAPHAASAYNAGKWSGRSRTEAPMTRWPKAVTRQRRERGIFATSP